MVDDDICYSGGAIGSDLAWGAAAHVHGHQVQHISFAGHKIDAPTGAIIRRLDLKTLASADAHCHKINEILQRRFPPASLFTTNLLRRNRFIYEASKAIYGVGQFKKTSSGPGYSLADINGGTAWGMAGFVMQHTFEECAAYFFDQNLCSWYKWSNGWKAIAAPPAPRGAWSGIGIRAINHAGREAIKNSFLSQDEQ